MKSKLHQGGDAERKQVLLEQRHHKRSSPWRCLWRLQFAAYAAVVLLLLDRLERLVCKMLPPLEPEGDCATMGPWLFWLATGVIVMSVIACVSQGASDLYRKRHKQENLRRF